MSVKVENLEKSMAKITVEVDAADFEKAIKKAYDKDKNRFNIPGFRKGHAPLSMIEKMFGEQVFYEDALNVVLDETYPDAAKESQLDIVSRPEIGVDQIGKGKNLIYTATVAVKPEVKLGEYKGVTVDKADTTITAEEIEKRLDREREKNARTVEVEREIKKDDIAKIDFTGYVDDKEFEGGKGEDYDLTIGSGTFIPGFEDQLIGHKKGDKVTVKVTFPSDYSNTDLAGKDAEFAVTINSVKTTPELTEQWLKDNASAIGTSATTIDEFRSEQKGLLEAQINYQYDSNVHQSALEQIVDKSEFSISDEMNDYAYAYVVQQEIQQYQQYGYDLAGAMNVLGISVSDFETEMKSYAEDFAKQKLVMKTIAEEQNISATSEMLDALAEKISGLSGTKTNRIQLIEKYGGDAVKEEAVNDAVFDYIVSQIKVVETETTTAAN